MHCNKAQVLIAQTSVVVPMGGYIAGVHHLLEEISMNCGKEISTKRQRTLQENFRNAYMCIELNAPAIVTLLMKIRKVIMLFFYGCSAPNPVKNI